MPPNRSSGCCVICGRRGRGCRAGRRRGGWSCTARTSCAGGVGAMCGVSLAASLLIRWRCCCGRRPAWPGWLGLSRWQLRSWSSSSSTPCSRSSRRCRPSGPWRRCRPTCRSTRPCCGMGLRSRSRRSSWSPAMCCCWRRATGSPPMRGCWPGRSRLTPPPSPVSRCRSRAPRAGRTPGSRCCRPGIWSSVARPARAARPAPLSWPRACAPSLAASPPCRSGSSPSRARWNARSGGLPG